MGKDEESMGNTVAQNILKYLTQKSLKCADIRLAQNK